MKRSISRFIITLLSIFLFFINLQAEDFKYVGVQKCKTCHKSKKSGSQYGIWKKAAHAAALKSLSSKKSLDYAAKNKLGDPAKAPECLNCHATMAAIDQNLIDPTGRLTMEEGVSCESCHGPGSEYKKMSIMKDREKAIANGLIIPEEKVCLVCHNEKNPFFKPFDYKDRVTRVQHPIPGKK